jgi:autotransporter-associated beta strand protein
LGANSVIDVAGTELTINGHINGVAYGFTKQGAGRLVLGATNAYTGTTQIDAGTVVVANTGNLGANTTNLMMATGTTLDLQNALTLGSLSMAGTASITNTAGTSSLTVTGSSLISNLVKTNGNQTYLGDVELANTSAIQTLGGNVMFAGTVTAPSNTKSARNNLTINAGAGNVTFNGRVGEDPSVNSLYRNFVSNGNLYKLTVTGGKIFINADVMTMEEQVYNGAVVIGDNGTNGNLRTLLSLDPMIYFNGTVDDAVANTHKLVARAVSVAFPGSIAEVPKVMFEKAVGSIAQLMSLEAITGIQSIAGGAKAGDVDPAATLNPFTMVGQVVVKGSVSTLQDQTYVANSMEIGGTDPKLTLTTKSGIINIFAGQNINHPILPGVRAAAGTQIAIKGKYSKETGAALKASGVKFSEDSKGGFEAALFLREVTRERIAKKASDGKATIEVGEAVVADCNGANEKGKCDAK